MFARIRISAICAAAACAGATLLLPVAGAYAEEVAFAYHPEELRSAEGTEALLMRLRKVARIACRNDIRVPNKAEKQCRKSVETQWLAGIGNPMLKRIALAD